MFAFPVLRGYDARKLASTLLWIGLLTGCGARPSASSPVPGPDHPASSERSDTGTGQAQAVEPLGRDVEPVLPEAPEIVALTDLTQALREAGVPVAGIGKPADSPLGVAGHAFLVGSAEVQAYEYPSEGERQTVSDTIDPTGFAVGGVPLDWPGRPNIWASGRLIVVYPGSDGGTVLLLSGLLGDPLTAPAAYFDDPYPPAVLAVIGAVTEQLQISPEEVVVAAYEPADWPDGCLGLADPGEVCAAALTPGWRIILEAVDRTFVFRADDLGSQVRLE